MRPCGGRRVTMIVSSRAGDSAAGVFRAVCRAGLVTLTLWLAGAGVAVASRWRVERTPKGVGDLSAVSCYSADACTAVADEVALRSDGRRWSSEKTARPRASRRWQLSDVSCPSGTACIAVGRLNPRASRSVALAERWDGSTWHVQRLPVPGGESTSSDLSRVSCTSPSACTAIGHVGLHSDLLIERWNGTKWSIQRLPDTSIELSDVSCTAQALCTAVGYQIAPDSSGVVAARWSGDKWSISEAPRSYFGVDINAVSCPTVRACTWVGYFDGGSSGTEAVAGRWDGTSWTSPAFTGASTLNGVSCTSATACTAVADDGTARTWNGGRWAAQQTAIEVTRPYLRDVSCVSRKVCVAVGELDFTSGGPHSVRAVVERRS